MNVFSSLGREKMTNGDLSIHQHFFLQNGQEIVGKKEQQILHICHKQ